MLEQVTVTYPSGVVWNLQPEDVTQETLGEIFNCAGETDCRELIASQAYDNLLFGAKSRNVYKTVNGLVIITRHRPTTVDKAGLRPLAVWMANPDVHTAILVVSAIVLFIRILFLAETGR